MTFYERYEALCRVRGIEPCSQSTAEKLGTTRSNISYWKKGTKPNVEIVRSAATIMLRRKNTMRIPCCTAGMAAPMCS